MVNEGKQLSLSALLALLKDVPAYTELAAALSTTRGEHRATVLDAAKPYLIAALYQELGLPIMVIKAQPESARKLHDQLQVWCPPSAELHRLPEPDFLPYEGGQPPALSYQAIERLKALAALTAREDNHRRPLVVTSALAFMTKTLPHREFLAACHALKPGMTAEPLELMRRWQGLGYEVQDTVEMPGQMSRRGGIIDIFPPCNQLPVRIEFFGNRIESLRCFDPESQRSTDPITSLTVTPARESQPAGGSVLDYLADDALLVLDDPDAIELAINRLNEEAQDLRSARAEKGGLPEDFPSPHLTWQEIESQVKQKQCLALVTPVRGGPVLPFASVQSYGSQLERFLKAARQMVDRKQRVVVVSHQANRLAELLEKEEIHTSPASQIEHIPPPGSITLLQGSLDGGWLLADRLTVVSDVELFGFVKQPRARRRRPIPRQWFLPQLAPGDYVVHVDHGIARFHGLTRMSSDGAEREYLVLEYASGDRLYVPTERIDRVSRYIGAGDQAPNLTRLRSPEWQRTKKRVKESVAEIARELLELYAAREVTPGFAFSRDSLWQQELEASFPYMETPDQLEAIMAVKEDMEKAKPMDRLICGDVGYGKTEIALRAAFKAVMDGKQVAVLVPTTVLAQQHFLTFTERLQTFPLRVEMLSRFCPPEKEKEILAGLANGTVDICIGTHRLLQKDVAFKDLGLVIIDEEQQFGVVQKEKLKQIRKEVDTLALSATPIPRTLHMSLSGIRDMSIVGTPPEERLSVQTYVGPYDPALVRQVILRELERNGQVFFVHNRVQSIALAARKLQELVPEARIAIAHGQMPEEQLEKVMTDFIANKYDVLVTTTIIQLGLDMPNVNTLIIDQSDKFGLAQLYQLRGRVGRGINQAYAYLFYDRRKRLTPQAYKRLETIFEATELGSGFGIAMKDLEIRGAGNLLGVKQSGHIAALGFDLYCQMLAEAVEELKASSSSPVAAVEASPSTLSLEGRGMGEGAPTKGVVVPAKGVVARTNGAIALTEGVTASRSCEPEAWQEAKQSPTISLPLDAHIPEEYVPNLSTRLTLYHRLAKVEDVEEVQDTAGELQDRFGPMPGPVENLLYIVKIKILAMEAGVNSVSTQGRQIVIKPREGAGSPLKATQPITEALRGPSPLKGTQAVTAPPKVGPPLKGTQAVTEPPKATAPLKIRGDRGVMNKYLGSGVKIGPTQIRLDTRLLGDRWKLVLEEILRSNRA